MISDSRGKHVFGNVPPGVDIELKTVKGLKTEIFALLTESEIPSLIEGHEMSSTEEKLNSSNYYFVTDVSLDVNPWTGTTRV